MVNSQAWLLDKPIEQAAIVLGVFLLVQRATGKIDQSIGPAREGQFGRFQRQFAETELLDE